MIRFATIGTNFVTGWMLEAARSCPELHYAAVYSRSAEKAREFASRHGAEAIHTDLDALADDPGVDAVYIASPNCMHFEQAARMLAHGKHVLCEKTITSNRHELARLLEIAAENRVILLEAMRSVFDPGFRAIEENLHKLGKIRRASFQYCQYSSRYDKFKAGIIENAFNPALSNGSLMDIGVYCVHPLVKLFGRPDRIVADAVFLDNGVDGAGTILGSWKCGMQSELLYSKITNSRVPSQIQGEAGSMIIREIANPHEVTIIRNDGTSECVYSRADKSSNNMVYELREWCRLIREGNGENPHNRASLLELEVMDEARRLTGIRFPADEAWKECSRPQVFRSFPQNGD